MGNVKDAIWKSPDLQMHLVVFLWGGTAILGKLISVSGPVLVWHRIWMTVLVLAIIPGVLTKIKHFSKKNWLHLGIIGVLTALHWVCFYGSIKIANSASVALSALATSTFFAAILEPLLTQVKFEKFNLFLAVLVFIGVRLIFMDEGIHAGAFGIAILAAFLSALFSTLNKKWATSLDAKSATLVELGIGFVFLSFVLPVFTGWDNLWSEIVPLPGDWIYLIILSVFCTAFTFVVALHCLKYISAFKSNLYVNLEPVYGILMASVLFNELEELSLHFVLGAVIIISTVFIKPFLKRIVKL